MEKKLPEGWKITNLEHICNLVTDGTHDKIPRVDKEIGVPIVTPKDITEDGISFKNVNYITKEQHQQIIRRSKPEKGDVLYSNIGTIGKPTIVDVDFEFSIKNVALFKIKEALVFNKYIRYYLKCEHVHNFLLKKADGGNQKFISINSLKNIEIVLPPLETQQKIVSILEKAEETQKLRAQADELTQKLLENVFLEMFGDPMENSKQFDVIQLKSLFSEEKEGTKCGPFGSALKKHEYVEKGIQVWTMDNITENKFTKNGCLFITKEKYQELKAYSVDEGDILISRAGTVGKMCVVNSIDDPSIISTNLIRLSLNPSKIEPIYFTSLMTYFKGRIGRLKTGEDGAYTFMNTGVLKDLRIPLPPFKLQRSFAKIVEQVEKTSYNQNQSYLEINTLFDALMQKAFTGELVS